MTRWLVFNFYAPIYSYIFKVNLQSEISEIMQSIVVQPKDKKEFLFITEILKRLGIKSKVLTIEDREDIGLGLAIEAGIKSRSVSKLSILKVLGRS